MATEVLTLPVFETVLGNLVRDSREPLCDLKHGFVVSEIEDPAEDMVDIHAAHVSVSLALLAEHEPFQNWTAIHELRTVFTYSQRHIDGLVAAYFQAHTLHTADDDAQSRLTLEGYDLSDGEHKIVKNKLARGLGTSSLNAITGKHLEQEFLDTPSLWAYGGDRQPDAVVGVATRPGQTVVFPNGYEAGPDSVPSRLWLHAAETVSESGEAYQRDVSLSRLESVC